MDKETLDLLLSIQENIKKGFNEVNKRLDRIELESNNELISVLRQVDKKVNNIVADKDEIRFLKDKLITLEKEVFLLKNKQ